MVRQGMNNDGIFNQLTKSVRVKVLGCFHRLNLLCNALPGLTKHSVVTSQFSTLLGQKEKLKTMSFLSSVNISNLILPLSAPWSDVYFFPV